MTALTDVLPVTSAAPAASERLRGPMWLRRPLLRATACVLVTLLVGTGDWMTGIELPFTMLYLLPIGVATWFVSRGLGLAVTLVSTACVTAALVHDGLSTAGVAWNVAGAMLLFAGGVWVTDRLRHYVEHENAMRRLAIDQLRHAERLNVIGTLASGVAHELGTPLNVIAGCAEFLEEDISDEKLRKRTRMILDQVTKSSTIIRRLLDFARRGEHTRARVDLSTLANAVADMLRSTATKQGCALTVSAPQHVWVEGNKAELEEVLSNLILNAIQSMDRGTVSIRVGTATRANQVLACVAVEDQGCGIPPENLTRIFDPFFTTKGVGQGTGLGLSVSYGIVHDHAGAIEVASTPGKGTLVTVLLPLS